MVDRLKYFVLAMLFAASAEASYIVPTPQPTFAYTPPTPVPTATSVPTATPQTIPTALPTATPLVFSIKSGANTACTTTCGASICISGQDTATNALVACSDATADQCICSP